MTRHFLQVFIKTDVNEDVNRILASWGGKTDLINYFQTIPNLSHKSREMIMLVDHYERIDHPLTIEIIKLLAATIRFRRLTDFTFTDDEIKNFNHQELWILNLFNEMAKVFKIAQHVRDQQHPDSDSYIVLSDAIDYCLKSIKNRINELNTKSDSIFKLFLAKPNDLTRIVLDAS